MKVSIFYACKLIIVVSLSSQAKSQSNSGVTDLPISSSNHPDSIRVIADAQLGKKGSKRWLLGNHYRKEWIIPVSVPQVGLDTLHGGVYATREGGGKQTQSLRLRLDVDSSRQYVLRSVEKYPERALPKDLAGTLADRFVKDQISSSHPFAPLVVTRLAQAAGIYHTNPRMVYIGRSQRLGRYDSLWGNRLYLLEERPQGNWQEAAFFGHSSSLINTEELQHLLQQSPNNKVDQRAFLRARLLDILIGDWDRHEDQWAWASTSENNFMVYRPIPKDRDQAFANLDGLLPWLGRRKWAFRRAQHFDYQIHDLKGLVWSGRNIDRLLLNSLEWSDWQKEVQSLQMTWTDEVLRMATKALPKELYPFNGQLITEKLQHRRNDLHKYAWLYYTLLAEEVEWAGTNRADYFLISAATDSSFTISHFYQNEGQSVLLKKRVFKNSDTKALTIYGLDGNDEYHFEGLPPTNVRLRLVGGLGEDRYYASPAQNHTSAVVYDTSTTQQIAPAFYKRKHRYNPLTHDYQYGQHRYSIARPLLLPGYNPDDGLLIGIGLRYNRARWGHSPYAQQHLFKADYAMKTKAYRFSYEGLFDNVIAAWDLYVNGQLNQPNYVLNFYGLGNETRLTTTNRDFNRVRIDQLIVKAGFQRTFTNRHTIRLLGTVLSFNVEENTKRFVSRQNTKLDSLDFEQTNWLGGNATYIFSTTTEQHFPTKGIFWQTQASYQYSNQHTRHLVNPSTAISFYIPISSFVLAARVGGATLWGDPQFFQYNQLGGLENLRGYRRTRFSGKSMVYNNTEVRIPLTDVKSLLLNGKLGMTLFCDNGRVWMPGEDSNKWHWGYGAGVWVIPFGRVAFSAHMGFSKEDEVLTVKTGFLF